MSILRIEFDGPRTIEAAIAEALRYSRQTNLPAVFWFDGIDVSVDPTEHEDLVLARWLKADESIPAPPEVSNDEAVWNYLTMRPPHPEAKALLLIVKARSRNGYSIGWCVVHRDPNDHTAVGAKDSDVVSVMTNDVVDLDRFIEVIRNDVTASIKGNVIPTTVVVDLIHDRPAVDGITFWPAALYEAFNALDLDGRKTWLGR